MALVIVNAYGDEVDGVKVTVEERPGGHRVARIRARGYKARSAVLWGAGVETKRDQRVFLGFDLSEVAYGENTLEDACLLNLRAAASHATAAMWGEAALQTWIGRPIVKRPDRCYFNSPDDEEFVESRILAGLDRTEAWRRVSGSLHDPPDTGNPSGYKYIGSWKQTQVEPGLQVTVWKDMSGYVYELDLDEHKDVFGHAYEVIRNHTTGRVTHPHVINQGLARRRGIVSYKLRPRVAMA